MGINLLERRRAMMKSKSDIPNAYELVNYLESDGSSYINSLLIPADDLTYEVKFQFTKDLPENHTATVLGCYSSGSRARCQFNYMRNGVLGWGRSFERSTKDYDKDMHIARISRNSFLVDNVNIYTPNSHDFSVTSSVVQRIFLFGTNSIGQIPDDTITDGLRIYYFKVYRGSDLRRDFVPCVRKSDIENGFYEKVGRLFYQNAGNGELLSGN